MTRRGFLGGFVGLLGLGAVPCHGPAPREAVAGHVDTKETIDWVRREMFVGGLTPNERGRKLHEHRGMVFPKEMSWKQP
jgi:hypothetical protein